MTRAFDIIEDDLSGPEISALLRQHLEEMHRWSPACKVHAMPIERLREPDVTFYSAWSDGKLAACGAIKDLGGDKGELKSMRAANSFRGQGAGEAILLHLMEIARQRGYHWLGLETGRPDPFLPAQSLYRKHGFAECANFADYVADEFSLCMGQSL
ncbi:MAG: GNAT family N-acetyltransferase [Pontixanthobacter sp.]